MSAEAPGLAAQQRALLALIKDRPGPEPPAGQEPREKAADPYVDRVRGSRGLAMVRTIRAEWLRFDLRRVAPLTSAVLAQAGRLEAELTRLSRAAGTPAAADALGLYFCARHVADADPLVAAVAGTERALILIARGDQSQHEVPWDRDPAAVLNALLAGQVPAGEPGDFRVTVSKALPQLIEVRRPG